MLASLLEMKGLFFMSAAISVAGAVFSFLWIPVTKDKSMLELEMLFAPKKDLKTGLDLFGQQVILDTEKKPELYDDIPYEWVNEKILLRKRKSF